MLLLIARLGIKLRLVNGAQFSVQFCALKTKTLVKNIFIVGAMSLSLKCFGKVAHFLNKLHVLLQIN